MSEILYPDYSKLSDQEAFLRLPQIFQNALISALDTTEQAKPEAKENNPNIVELDNENYGAPPENSDIAAYKYGMQSPEASDIEPQAWEDERGNWVYNTPGVIKLIEILGRTFPLPNHLIAAINANPENFRQNAGHRDGNDGNFYGGNDCSCFLSFREGDVDRPVVIYLRKKDSLANMLPSFRRFHGFSVRFIADKK